MLTSSHTHKTGSFPTSTPVLLIWESPPGHGHRLPPLLFYTIRAYLPYDRLEVVGEMRVWAQTLIQCNQCSQASYAKTSPTLFSVGTHLTLKMGSTLISVGTHPTLKNGRNADQCSQASYAKMTPDADHAKMTADA